MSLRSLTRLRQFFASRFTLQDNALWRVMALLRPWRKQILLANAILILSSLLSGAALLSFYPLLNTTLKESGIIQEGAAEEEGVPQVSAVTGPAPNNPAATKEEMRQNLLRSVEGFGGIQEAKAFVLEQKAAFNAWMSGSLYRFVITYIAFILMLYILAGIAKFIGDLIFAKISVTVSTDLMRSLYANVLRQEMIFFDHTTSGTLLNTCYREIFQMQKMIPLLASRRVLLPAQMAIYFIMLLFISLKLSLLLLLLLPVIVLPTMLITRWLRKTAQQEIGDETGALDVMAQGLQGIQAIKAFGAERMEGEQLDPAIARQIRNTRRRRMVMSTVEPTVDLLNMIVLLTVFVVALFVFPEMFRDDQSRMLVFMMMITRFYKPMRTIMTLNVQMQRVQAVARNVFQLLDRKPLIDDTPESGPFPEHWNEIRFENVDLVYTLPKRKGKIQEREALRGVNFAVRRGETVALIGPNGAGKSSIVKLICRLYDPTAGEIRFSATPLSKIQLNQLRDRVCLITQHPVLFNRPVSENITFGMEGIAQEQIEGAARSVRAHDFIMRLPHGYDTLVGEGGKLLSGGERQKLVLARAFVRQPSLLIFDEPTAGLDRESVDELLTLIDDLHRRGMTIIWITHEREHLMHVQRVLELTPEKKVVEIPWPPAAV